MNVSIFWVRVMKCMCAHTDLGLYSHPKEFWGEWSLNPCKPREKSPLPENFPRGGSNPRHHGQRAHALPTELFRPPFCLLKTCFSLSLLKTCFCLRETLSMDAHIKQLCHILFCQLCRISKTGSFMSTDAANKLLSFILARLEISFPPPCPAPLPPPPSSQLSWMFEHGCLDTCAVLGALCMHVFHMLVKFVLVQRSSACFTWK